MSEYYHQQSESGNNINALSYCFADNKKRKKKQKHNTSTDKIISSIFFSLTLSFSLSCEAVSSAHFREKCIKQREIKRIVLIAVLYIMIYEKESCLC